MALKFEENQYAILRGRLSRDELDDSGNPTGEIPFGNTPGFSITIKSTTVDHYSSETRLSQKDKSRVVKVDRSAKITVDNLTMETLADFLSGSVETFTQSSGQVANKAMNVKPGAFYQLGQTPDNPAGDRNITGFVAESADGSKTFAEGTDYNLDPALGVLQIIKDGGISPAVGSIFVPIEVSYGRPASTWQRIKSGDNTVKSVALRVRSDNALGENHDYYLPNVNLSPTGDLPVISSEDKVVSVEFDADILKPQNQEAIYCDGRPVGV